MSLYNRLRLSHFREFHFFYFWLPGPLDKRDNKTHAEKIHNKTRNRGYAGGGVAKERERERVDEMGASRVGPIVVYLRGMNRDECVAPIPGRPCFTGR